MAHKLIQLVRSSLTHTTWGSWRKIMCRGERESLPGKCIRNAPRAIRQWHPGRQIASLASFNAKITNSVAQSDAYTLSSDKISCTCGECLTLVFARRKHFTFNVSRFAQNIYIFIDRCASNARIFFHSLERSGISVGLRKYLVSEKMHDISPFFHFLSFPWPKKN